MIPIRRKQKLRNSDRLVSDGDFLNVKYVSAGRRLQASEDFSSRGPKCKKAAHTASPWVIAARVSLTHAGTKARIGEAPSPRNKTEGIMNAAIHAG